LPLIWWEDGHFEGGPTEGPVLEVLPPFFEDPFKGYWPVTNHYMLNMIINVQGNEAFVETYAMAYHVTGANAEVLKQIIGPQKFSTLETDPNLPYEIICGLRY